MKKIVRQQNYLKQLIESQENQVISKQALKCLIRAVLEPLLDKPEVGVVLHRILNKDGLAGLIKRLEFSDIESYDYSDESHNLREKVWAKTEFICVLTHRFVSIILWDLNSDNENTVRYYSIYNSKLQNEALDIIHRNSVINVKNFQEQFKPDRRDNILLNSSIRCLLENLDEASKDAVLGFAEGQSQAPEKINQYEGKTRFVAHEIRNQLSICDLYTEVIRKHCAKNEIEDSTIQNALNCLTRAVKMANNSLIALKSTETNDLNLNNLREIVANVVNLTKVYFECKNIVYIVENEIDMNAMVDNEKFMAALINLVKNATEAFNIDDSRDGKYIKIKTERDGEFGLIRVSNNAGEIVEKEKIFEEGFTTKTSGSGLGLVICKKTIEEQFGELTLEQTSSECTEFVIKIGLV